MNLKPAFDLTAKNAKSASACAEASARQVRLRPTTAQQGRKGGIPRSVAAAGMGRPDGVGRGCTPQFRRSRHPGVLPKAKHGKNSAHFIRRAHEIPSNCSGFNVAGPEDPPSLKLRRAGGHAPWLGQHAHPSRSAGRAVFMEEAWGAGRCARAVRRWARVKRQRTGALQDASRVPRVQCTSSFAVMACALRFLIVINWLRALSRLPQSGTAELQGATPTSPLGWAKESRPVGPEASAA